MTTPAPATRVPVWTMIVLCAAALIEYFEINMMYVILPTLYKQFGDPAAVGWAVTIFGLVGASSVALGGRLGDVVGYRAVLLYAVAASAVGSFVSATSHSLWQLVLGRGIQGTAAVILPLAIGVMRTVIATAGRQKFGTGVIAGVAYSAAGISPLVGAVMLVDLGWHSIFFLSGSLAVLVFFAVLTLPKAQADSGRWNDVDILGGIAIAPGIALLLVGITQSRAWGISNPLTLLFLVGGVVLLVLWYLYERRLTNPVVDFTLFRSRAFTGSCVAFALFGIGSLSVASTQAVVAQAPKTAGGFGASAPTYGVIALIAAAVGTVVNMLAGWVAMKLSARAALVIGATITAAVYLTFSLLLLGGAFRELILLGGYMVLAGVGVATMNTALPSVVPEAVPTDRTGVALGVQQVVKQASQSAGLQIVAVMMVLLPLVAATPGGRATFPASGSVAAAHIFAAVLTLLIVPVALYANRHAENSRRHEQKPVVAAD